MAKALTTVEKLLSRVNGIDTGELSTVLYQCLSSATVQIATSLESKSFDLIVGNVETFLIPKDTHILRNRFLSFRLHKGFINQGTTPLIVKYGLTQEDLLTATNVVDASLHIDVEQGLVKFDAYESQNGFLEVYGDEQNSQGLAGYLFQITYDSGFAFEDQADGEVFIDVPDWLEEAALIKGREVYQLTVPSKNKKAETGSINLDALLASHYRYYPSAIRPIV